MSIRFIDNVENRNNNNLQQLAPFRIILNDRAIIGKNDVTEKHGVEFKESFYHEINNKSVMKKLNEQFIVTISDAQSVECVSKNTELIDDNQYMEIYWIVYHILFNWMSIENWCHVLEEKYHLLELSDTECKYFINYDKNLNFINKLDDLIKDFNRSAFVKLEHGSTKHNFDPYEITSGEELFEQICASNACLNQLKARHKKEHYIFITKWDPDVSKGNELRVFIDNNVVSGISQQYIHSVYPFMTSCVSRMPEVIFESVQKLWNDISPKLEYLTCVLDVSVYLRDDEYVCKLIEINGYGRWGPAGSSLYEWERDDPLMNNLEIRIRV